MQKQFSAGDNVKVVVHPYMDYIGTVRKVSKFGFGRKPFKVDLGDGVEHEFDHGELEPYDGSEPAYGQPR